LNRALCLAKVANYRGAVASCTIVLEDDRFNTKALYRRATAYLAMEDFSNALHDTLSLLEASKRRNSQLE
jgi:hypothetical protein